MTLAAPQCSLSSELKSSGRFVPPHTVILYVTAGNINLKYRFKRSCSGKNLLFFMRNNLLTKLFFSPLTYVDQPSLSSLSTPMSRLCVTRSKMLSPRYTGGWGPVKILRGLACIQIFSGAGSACFSLTTHTARLGIDLAQRRLRQCSSL